jgi:hypothetical protein
MSMNGMMLCGGLYLQMRDMMQVHFSTVLSRCLIHNAHLGKIPSLKKLRSKNNTLKEKV